MKKEKDTGKTFKEYTGKELRVFLDKKQTEVRESNQKITNTYLSGVGYGAKVFIINSHLGLIL